LEEELADIKDFVNIEGKKAGPESKLRNETRERKQKRSILKRPQRRRSPLRHTQVIIRLATKAFVDLLIKSPSLLCDLASLSRP
jgi:hypothetical protein